MIKLRQILVFAAVVAVFLLIVLMGGNALRAAPAPANVPYVVGAVAIGPGDPSNGPEGIAVDTQRNRIFVTNSKDNTVYVINGETNQVISAIQHAALVTPWGAAYNPNNGKVYVASNARNTIVIINAATLAIEGEIGDPSLNLPDQVVVDALHNVIYVSNSQGLQITVINGATNTVINRIYSVLPAPHHMAVDPSRLRLYVSNLYYLAEGGPDYMMVFSTLSFTEIGRRGAMAGPQGLAVRSVDGKIYVAQKFSDTGQWRVAVVNATDLSFAVPFPGLVVGGRNLMGAVYAPGSDRVYVNGYDSHTVDVIDASQNTLLTTLSVGLHPASGIAVNPNTGRVYVANRGSGSLTIIQDTPAAPPESPTPTPTPSPSPTPLCYKDSAEPDDAPAQAKLINTAGLSQQHNICPAGDQDWMVFEVRTAGALTMQTQNLVGGTDTMLYLYAPDGETLLAFNDDIGGSSGPDSEANANKKGLSAGELASRIVYTFTKAGRYYIKVKDFNGDAYGTNRRYDVLISGGPPYNKQVFLPVIISDY